jgi:hypothetical protein
MECQLKLSYKMQKQMKKLYGKLKARDIAFTRSLTKLLKENSLNIKEK